MKRNSFAAITGVALLISVALLCIVAVFSGLVDTPAEIFPETPSSSPPPGTAAPLAPEKVLPYIHDSYMIYYGRLDDDVIEMARRYKVAILHPKQGNVTREQISRIQASGTLVLGYISIGEDLRTYGMTPSQILADPRIFNDGTGPRIDPRPPGAAHLDGVDPLGIPSPGGTGFPSYYLDDNNHDGKPDINTVFNCAFTNVGDPQWFEVLDQMTLDGVDALSGIREILTTDFGRGLGCDGLFLDTIDTCAPNSYTDDSSFNKSHFEWTAPGLSLFLERLKNKYPDTLVLQNRGMFYYDPRLPHYKYNPRPYVDYLLVESYRLDSDPGSLYNEGFYLDNKNAYMPKIMAEAGRPDGFAILSLGYAEGPAEYKLKETLLGASGKGLDILMEDIRQAQDYAGYKHYITDGGVMLVNDFVVTHEDKTDVDPPVWSSVYNESADWPPQAPAPRVGVRQAVPVEGGVMVRWDVALDRSGVQYTLYYQKTPFDFGADPDLTGAEALRLIPEIGEGYENGMGPDIYPYQAVVEGLEAGQVYHFVIRAMDTHGNEEKNTVTVIGVP